MGRLSKRIRAIHELVDVRRAYSLREGIELLRSFPRAKFDESVDVAINLGVDARKSDQQIRGAVNLPRGTGRVVRVAVFAEGDRAGAATEAGADVVGYQDLLERMQGGELDYDVVIATPEAMPMLGKLGKILGPRGLMPNPKVGTVSSDVAQAVANAKAGQVRYRTDKNGIVHCAVGKVSFETDALVENIQELVNELKRVKPAVAKGVYLRRMSLSTTMGTGVQIDLATV